MIAITCFTGNSRIYSPIQRCLRKMSEAERSDYATQLSDYVAMRNTRRNNLEVTNVN
jgi:hypothetical protein